METVIILTTRPTDSIASALAGLRPTAAIEVQELHRFTLSAAQRTTQTIPFSGALILRCDALQGGDTATLIEQALAGALDDNDRIGAFGVIGPHRGEGRLETCEHINLALTQPVAGMTAAFEQWYETQHYPDGLRLPGYVGGQRFMLHDSATPRVPPLRYLALYELEGVPLKTTIATLAARSGTAEMPISPAFDRTSYWAWYFDRTTT